MNDPLVSVIMPAYNVQDYIAQSIESILSQTYRNFELIILDDASSDNTWEVINDYSAKDNRIVAVRNERNLYIAGNRNKGIGLAKGKYIVWQDSDDISVPTRVEKQVKFMEDHPNVGICGGYLQSFNENGNLDVREYDVDDESLRGNIFKYSPVAQPAAIVRRECFEQLGMFDLKYPPAEDIDMSFRIGTKYKFANIPEVVIYYREHVASNTYTKLRKQIRSSLDIRKKYSKNYGYTMTLTDHLAYFITWLVQFIPPKVTIALFKLSRFIVRAKGLKY